MESDENEKDNEGKLEAQGREYRGKGAKSEDLSPAGCWLGIGQSAAAEWKRARATSLHVWKKKEKEKRKETSI